MTNASEAQAMVHYELLQRRKRCPGCAPGYGTGLECRHHQVAHRPEVQFMQRTETTMRRAARRMERGIEVKLFVTVTPGWRPYNAMFSVIRDD